MDSYNLLLLAFGTGVIALVALVYRQLTFWKSKGIPHLEPVPIFGNQAPLFFRLKSFPEFVQWIYWRHPVAKYIGLMDFNTPVVVLRDPELIKNVCIRNFEHFPDHLTFINEDADPLFGRNLFALRGESWKNMRSILSPSFTASKMKFMFQVVAECSHEFVDYLYQHLEQTESIEMLDVFIRYTNDVIATAAFGISVNSIKDKSNEFYIRGKEVCSFGTIRRTLAMLASRTCPRLMKPLGITFLSRATNEFFKRLVSETIKIREERGIVRPDMMHLMIQAKNKDYDVQMTTEDIIAQVFIFFLAGIDTSSRLMCFLAHELAVNPEIQNRLRDEVDRFTVEGDAEISYEALHEMKYMDMVVSEALRKYPPAAFMNRLCSRSYPLPAAMSGCEEFTIKPNMIIWLPIYALHHDPKYFPDPEKFDPERFNDDNKTKIVPYTYMPFGLGPRNCIGNRFALMEIKILFFHMLQKFVIKADDKTVHPIPFSKKTFNMSSDNGFWLKMEKRKC